MPAAAWEGDKFHCATDVSEKHSIRQRLLSGVQSPHKMSLCWGSEEDFDEGRNWGTCGPHAPSENPKTASALPATASSQGEGPSGGPEPKTARSHKKTL